MSDNWPWAVKLRVAKKILRMLHCYLKRWSFQNGMKGILTCWSLVSSSPDELGHQPPSGFASSTASEHMTDPSHFMKRRNPGTLLRAQLNVSTFIDHIFSGSERNLGKPMRTSNTRDSNRSLERSKQVVTNLSNILRSELLLDLFQPRVVLVDISVNWRRGTCMTSSFSARYLLLCWYNLSSLSQWNIKKSKSRVESRL